MKSLITFALAAVSAHTSQPQYPTSQPEIINPVVPEPGSNGNLNNVQLPETNHVCKSHCVNNDILGLVRVNVETLKLVNANAKVNLNEDCGDLINVKILANLLNQRSNDQNGIINALPTNNILRRFDGLTGIKVVDDIIPPTGVAASDALNLLH